MARLIVSGVAHPPPINKSEYDLPPTIFQSQKFLSELIGCPVTVDSNHANTRLAGELVIACRETMGGKAVGDMLNVLARCQNNTARASHGRVSDAWIGNDGALRVNVDVSNAPALVKQTIKDGALRGLSISHHTAPDGTHTPIELGICFRPLRNGCFITHINKGFVYKSKTNNFTMAAAISNSDSSKQALEEFATLVTSPSTVEQQEKLAELFTTLVSRLSDTEARNAVYSEQMRATEEKNRIEREEAVKVQSGLLAGAMEQMGGTGLTEDELKLWEQLGTSNPALLNMATKQFVTAAARFTDKSGVLSDRARGMIKNAADSFDNVRRPAVGEKRSADDEQTSTSQRTKSEHHAHVKALMQQMRKK
jgi:hypothetical protein